MHQDFTQTKYNSSKTQHLCAHESKPQAFIHKSASVTTNRRAIEGDRLLTKVTEITKYRQIGTVLPGPRGRTINFQGFSRHLYSITAIFNYTPHVWKRLHRKITVHKVSDFMLVLDHKNFSNLGNILNLDSGHAKTSNSQVFPQLYEP